MIFQACFFVAPCLANLSDRHLIYLIWGERKQRLHVSVGGLPHLLSTGQLATIEEMAVVSKETVGNSWEIWNAILGHKYHQIHSILGHKYHQIHWNRVISSEWSQHLQQKWFWLQSVNGWVLSTRSIIFCWRQHSESVHGYSETRSGSNVWKEHTHTEGRKYDTAHFLLQIVDLFASNDCLDDSDGICCLKWRIKGPRNFQPSAWILPR